nr:MAG TPA: hypothetical protein [Caudoviricetes sp.]
MKIKLLDIKLIVNAISLLFFFYTYHSLAIYPIKHTPYTGYL